MSVDLNDSADVCILVPKRDEFRCVLNVFGIDTPVDDLPFLRNERLSYGLCEINDLRIALVLMDGQTNSAAALAAHEVLVSLRPTHIFLVGTAAGNSSRAMLGDVRFSEKVIHVSEWVSRPDEERSPRSDHRRIRNLLRRDMGSFVESVAHMRQYQQELYGVLSNHLGTEAVDDVFHSLSHRVALSPVISADVLSRDPKEMKRIWAIDDRAEVYDMESGGLGQALEGETGVFWGSIRGVSDLGDAAKSSVGGMRDIASYAAALAVKLFCAEGLSKSHPSTVRPNILMAPRLDESQHYAANSSNYILELVRAQLGISLPQASLARHMSFDQFVTMIRAYATEELSGQSIQVLEDIRQTYYREKYLEYSYENDIRGHFESWDEEVRELLAFSGREYLGSARVLDVGVGNGEELKRLFLSAAEVWGVDIDRMLLERAKSVRSDLKVVQCSADALRGVPSGHFDVYVALRSLVCRFIDVQLALAEALRVLKPGGLCMVSIPNGYREWRDDNSVVVRGLKEPGGTDFVDPIRPYDIQNEYVRHLTGLGFEQIGVRMILTDIYITCLKPGGDYTMSPRIAATASG